MNIQEKIMETKQKIAGCTEKEKKADLKDYLQQLLVTEQNEQLRHIKFKCSCKKEVNPYGDLPKGVIYSGVDDENNPIFKCKECEDYIWG